MAQPNDGDAIDLVVSQIIDAACASMGFVFDPNAPSNVDKRARLHTEIRNLLLFAPSIVRARTVLYDVHQTCSTLLPGGRSSLTDDGPALRTRLRTLAGQARRAMEQLRGDLTPAATPTRK